MWEGIHKKITKRFTKFSKFFSEFMANIESFGFLCLRLTFDPLNSRMNKKFLTVVSASFF